MNEQEATTLDGLEQDNLTSEPEQDNSIDVEPEAEPEEAANREPESKPFADILTDVSEDFLKEYGEIRDEIDAKRAKSQFNAVKKMHEVSQKLSERDKQQEQNKFQEQERAISSQNTEIQQKYDAIFSELDTAKQQAISYLHEQLQADRIDSLQYTQGLETVNQNYLAKRLEFLQGYDKETKEYQAKEKEFKSSRTEKLWQEKATAYKEKLELDEYKTVIDAYKEAGFNNPEDVDFIVKAVEKAISAYENRKANQSKVEKQNKDDKAKLKSVNNFNDGLAPKPSIEGKPAYSDIAKLAEKGDDAFAKWAMS